MHVAILQLNLRIAGSHSLKDKRQVLQSLMDRVRRRFNISVAEVDHQDAWQNATIAFASVANERRFLDETMAKVEAFVDSEPRVEITASEIEIL